MTRSLSALLLGFALVLTACGGGSDETEAKKPSAAEAVQVLHDAVDATLSVDSMAIDSEANLQVMANEFRFGVDGAVDYENLVGGVTLTTEQAGATNLMEIRLDGSRLWVRPEGAGVPPVPEGKTWAEGDVQAITAGDAIEPSGLAGVVIALRAAEEVEVGDSKEIDGVPARQYRTTVVYADAVESAGADREAFNSALSLTGVDDADLNIEVWIGDDGVIRHFDLDIDSHGKPVDGTYEIRISEVGQQINAPETPAAGDVLTGPAAAAYIAQTTG